MPLPNPPEDLDYSKCTIHIECTNHGYLGDLAQWRRNRSPGAAEEYPQGIIYPDQPTHTPDCRQRLAELEATVAVLKYRLAEVEEMRQLDHIRARLKTLGINLVVTDKVEGAIILDKALRGYRII